MITAKDILSDAAKLVTEDREAMYGNPKDTLIRVARLWSAYLNLKIEDEDVAWMMVLLKSARAQGNYNPDNYLDACGYAAIAGELAA